MMHPHSAPRLLGSVVLGSALLLAAGGSAAQDIGKGPVHPDPMNPGTGQPAQSVPGVPYQGRFIVGDGAPDIDMKDQRGQRFHLADARHQKPWLIVFARQPVDANSPAAALGDLDAIGVGLVVIGPFPADRLLPAIAKSDLRLITDRANRAARTYGLFDAVTTNVRTGAFLVDTRGKILLIMSGAIPSSSELVRMSKEALEAAGQRPVSAEQ